MIDWPLGCWIVSRKELLLKPTFDLKLYLSGAAELGGHLPTHIFEGQDKESNKPRILGKLESLSTLRTLKV